ncbi:MAG TPA: phosphate ABC transporter permease subunit PstC [Thermoanaerobaculia bacterium]|jgi:phosphate transport system permease protein|nr:phosphate ABC transporter permease subunit PstC [Thermoanaerobaculia bacterium]
MNPRHEAVFRRRERLRKAQNALMTGTFSVAGWVAIVFIFLIFLFTFKETIPIFTDKEVQHEANLHKFFVEAQEGPTITDRYIWQPTSDVPKVSLWPIILGTLKATIVGLLFACPVGVAAALFSSEFAPAKLREVIKPVIELLAGIPSVVMGFFALIVIATWLQDAFGFTYRLNAVNAGLALGFALVPIVYTISEDGLSAVPRAHREASYALGATRFQTAWKVVLPAAAPAVFASFVLAFGRAIGETMILLMAGGNAAITSFSLFDPLRTLSATIAAEMGEVVVGSAHYSALFFMGTLLFVITFVSNTLGQWVIKRMQLRMQGAAS